MKLAIIGATGNIGAPILDEALSRGHAVTGLTRDASKLEPRANLTARAADNADTAALASALKGHDAVLAAVKWTDNDVHKIIQAVRASGVKRCLFVVGAGSLRRPDGQLNFDYMKSLGIEPPTSKPAMNALEVLKTVDDLDWTAISPAFQISPGERTGKFRLGADEMVFDEKGESLISCEDFAVAILDEIETPKHIRRRFTVAY